MIKYLVLVVLLAGCGTSQNQENQKKNESQASKKEVADSLEKKSELPEIAINDSLNAIAQLIAGTYNGNNFSEVTENKNYREFSESFSKRWAAFDSSRVMKISEFRKGELDAKVKPEPTLFYPFSGPDILYANLFFPDAEKFILVGLEPVGTLPAFEKLKGDTLRRYYGGLNSSLHAILNFSFFRTESMSKDLRNGELDGTIHLLFLFLSRTGNAIVSAKPFTLDSLGEKKMVSFEKLAKEKLKTEGVEIKFKTSEGKLKELNYLSLNAADYFLKENAGFVNYLSRMKNFNTYLKGASYLLHKPTFTKIRNAILAGSTTVAQDDSGIALVFFEESTRWNFYLYGDYSKPIHMFARHYQPLLDTLYSRQGSKKLDFGMGYNYRDKNSNFMIATRKN